MPRKLPVLALVAAALLAAAPAPAAPPAKKLTPREQAAKDKADKDAADKADKDAADKDAADKDAREKADKDKADGASRAAADKDAADKADKDKAEKEKADALDPFEDSLKTYRFIGLRYRDAIVPRFLENVFGAAGGSTVNVPMVGVEFTSRRDRLEYDLALSYADFGMSPTLFKGKSQPDTAYELVQSGIKQILLTIDILYEFPLEKDKDGRTGRFSLLVGGGVGLGAVFGPLWRSQAYPLKPGASSSDPTQWAPCKAVGNPSPSYCENPNSHFSPDGKLNGPNSYTEASWAGGGSKPFIFPWIAIPQISFRYKPIKQLQTKVDLGFSTAGFFFGFSASYGL
jgi:hypothetical protein